MEDVEHHHKKRWGFLPVFSNLGFMLLWLGQLTSQLADRVFVYVLMLLAYELTHSNLGVALPLLAFGIPSVLIAPWAGVVVDKLDRKWIMVVTSGVRGLLILLLIPLISKSIGLIFLVTLLIYTATQFFAPAESSSIPELVEKKNLVVANSLFMITWMASSVVGFGLGAPFVNLMGEKGTFMASAVFYFVAASAILLIPLRSRIIPKTNVHPIKEVLMGFAFVKENQIVRYGLFKLFVAASAIAALSLLAISYAANVLMIGKQNFGYLIIAVGVGMLVGMLTLERLRHYLKLGTIVVISFLLSGGVLLWLSGTSDLRMALFLIMLLGIGNIFITSCIQTMLQKEIPPQIRGRVFGVQNMLINSAFTLPVVVFGLIADIWGILFAIAALGWIVLLTGFAGIFLPKFRTT